MGKDRVKDRKKTHASSSRQVPLKRWGRRGEIEVRGMEQRAEVSLPRHGQRCFIPPVKNVIYWILRRNILIDDRWRRIHGWGCESQYAAHLLSLSGGQCCWQDHHRQQQQGLRRQYLPYTLLHWR